MFRPRRVVPNTLDPALGGLDWAAMPGMFRGLVSMDNATFRAEVRQAISEELGVDWDTFSLDLDEEEDVAITNLEGVGALEAAKEWADMGKMRRKLEGILSFLEGPERLSAERLLKHDVVHEGSSQPLDVWNEVSAQSIVGCVKTAEPQKSGFRGRATLSQTERAMTRIKTGFSKPSTVRHLDSDEETDDEDAEEARMRTAHYIFGPYVGISSQIPDPTASPPSPIKESTNDQRLTTPASVNKNILPVFSSAEPLFPATPRATPPMRPSIAISKLDFLAREQHLDPCMPQRSWPTPLGSPFQLLSPAMSTRKRQRSEHDQPHPKKSQNLLQVTVNTATSEDYRREVDYPQTIDFSIERRLNVPGVTASEDSFEIMEQKEPKRCKTEREKGWRQPSKGPSEKMCVPQAETRIIPEPSNIVERSIRPLRRTSTERSSSAFRDAPDTTLRPRGSEDRESRSALRDKIARRLSKICPTLVRPAYTAKIDNGEASCEVGLPQKSEKERNIPEDLPLSDSQVSIDIEIDMEESRKLAQELEEKYVKGIRPGVAIPLLECMESQ
jgi:hypothetical protein